MAASSLLGQDLRLCVCSQYEERLRKPAESCLCRKHGENVQVLFLSLWFHDKPT